MFSDHGENIFGVFRDERDSGLLKMVSLSLTLDFSSFQTLLFSQTRSGRMKMFQQSGTQKFLPLGNFSCGRRDLTQTSVQILTPSFTDLMTSNKLFSEPEILLEHIIPKSQWLKTLKVYFLLVLHVHCQMGDSAPCLLTQGSFLIEQPTSNYRTLLVTVGERGKVLESLTVTIKYSGLEVTHIIIYVHNISCPDPMTCGLTQSQGPGSELLTCLKNSQKCWANRTNL